MPYLALPCLALPCLALPCLALPCLALPRLVRPPSRSPARIGPPSLGSARHCAASRSPPFDGEWNVPIAPPWVNLGRQAAGENQALQHMQNRRPRRSCTACPATASPHTPQPGSHLPRGGGQAAGPIAEGEFVYVSISIDPVLTTPMKTASRNLPILIASDNTSSRKPKLEDFAHVAAWWDNVKPHR